MLKELVSYTDIDNVQTTKTVYFNLTQYEVEAEIALEEMQARFQRFMEDVVGTDPNSPNREMTPPEKREMLAMVKQLIRYAYGVKDGKRFIKNEAVWDEFVETGAFSAFVYQLFLQKDAVNRFMEGIWPQGVDRPTPDGSVLSPAPDEPTLAAVPNATDAESRSLADYSDDELLAQSDSQFEDVVNKFREGNNIPPRLLIIGGRRMAQTGGPTE